jgi:hypothetical protein
MKMEGTGGFFGVAQWIMLIIVLSMATGCGGGGMSSAPPAILSVSQLMVSFNAAFGGSNPQAASINVTNTGKGTLTFTAASDSPWLSVTPGNGTAPQTIQVSVALGTLTTAPYTGHIMVTAADAQGSPATITVNFDVAGPPPSNTPFWAQWGANPQHTGMVSAAGQNVAHMLADIVYDKFVPQESAENEPRFGEALLTVHYQAPIVDGSDVYMMTKSGTYISCNPVGAWHNGVQCGPNTWNTMIWNETRFTWENNQLIPIWSFQSDWKPEPDSIHGAGVSIGEPVFHPAEANSFIYVPGAAGTIWKVNKSDGTSASHINPFNGVMIDTKNTFVASPLTADAQGNIYYNVVELVDPNGGAVDPWQNDVVGAWLVKVTPQDATKIVTYATLVPDGPAGTATTCPANFFFDFDPATTLPWPPALNAIAPTELCGSQRPAVNVAPVVATDGTVVYTVSRAQFVPAEAFLIAVNPDLTLKWDASLQSRLSDGCGVLVQFNDTSNSDVNLCRNGATPGVDPTTNAKGSGRVFDGPSSSPTVLPDGSILFGALTSYNGDRGHLFHFDANGNFLNAYDFGWDSTPAVYTHNSTYSIIIKDNHYPVPLYCNQNPNCQNVPEKYFISQLNPNMQIEWSFQSTNTQSCQRNADGTITCTPNTHPNGFEWCINMPAVDMHGNVYVNSEDGNLYAIPQGHSGVFTQATGNLFLNLALGASYTPLSIGPDGKFYTQNNGHLFVVGN